jgi:2,3-bisphosphoglycerate-dependent phosphoglycerate mutase
MRNEYHEKFPGNSGESCCDVYNRVIPYFNTYILPHLKAGKSVLVSSHGFVIRSLIKFLDRMSDDEFNLQMKLEKTDPPNCLLLAPTGN